MASMSDTCSRAIYLNGGKIVLTGTSAKRLKGITERKSEFIVKNFIMIDRSNVPKTFVM